MGINIGRFLFIIGLCAAVLYMGAGCSSAPTAVGGGEEIGKLRSAYSDLERRYNELAGDYRDLIQRQTTITAEQRRLIEEQSAAADRIGDGVNQLAETTGSIGQSVAGISANNREAVRLIQRYIESVSNQGSNHSRPDGKEQDVFPLGNDSDSGGGSALGDNITGQEN
jgi:uncharacterized protein YoxC